MSLSDSATDALLEGDLHQSRSPVSAASRDARPPFVSQASVVTACCAPSRERIRGGDLVLGISLAERRALDERPDPYAD